MRIKGSGERVSALALVWIHQMKADTATANKITTSARSTDANLIVVAGIVVLAIWLRSWRLNERGLWLSEAFSWRLTRFDWGELVARAAMDSNPPFYYLLLKLWSAAFGMSAGALRALGVLAGSATCAATYMFVNEAYRPDRAELVTAKGNARYAALLSAALVASSIFQVRWSWELRMYSLGVFFAALSSWSLLRALHCGNNRLGPWAVYAALALAFAYTHTFALISIVAQAFYVFGYLVLVKVVDISPDATPGGPTARRWAGPCIAAAIVVACYVPWFGVLLRQHEQVITGFWIPPITWQSVAWVARQMFIDPGAVSGGAAGWFCAAACAVGLASLALRPSSADWLLLLSAVFPIGTGAIISVWDTSIFYSRYFIFAHIFILAIFARLASRLSGLAVRWFVAFIAVGSFLLIDLNFFNQLSFEDTGGIRAAARYIGERRAPLEPVIVCSVYFYLPLRYELGEDAPCRLLESGRLLQYEGTAALTRGDFISPIEAAQSGAPRLWVVATRGRSADLRLSTGGWRAKSRQSFYENYVVRGDLTVVEYERTADCAVGGVPSAPNYGTKQR